MIAMFADYVENGKDGHNAYILQGVENNPEYYYSAAVRLYMELSEQGKSVQWVCVCPQAQTFKEIFAVADKGLQPPSVCIPFRFVED